MTPFELVEPTTLDEALGLLDPEDASVRALGGGTALMLMMKAGVFRPTRLVSLRKLKKLSGVAGTPDGGLVIGALTPLSDVERSALVEDRAGVIVRAMRRLSNVRVRNVATIGGNLAHGDPHMDLPPVLMALDASILVVGRAGERILKVEDLFVGYYETVLGLDLVQTDKQARLKYAGLHHQHQRGPARHGADGRILRIEERNRLFQRGRLRHFEGNHPGRPP